MVFQKRTNWIQNPDMATSAGLGLGSSVKVALDRTFPIESIFIRVRFTVTTGMATANADSLQNILNNVDLQISDGVKTRSVVKTSGPALLEYAAQVYGNLDRTTLTNINTNTTGAKEITYPLFCAHPQLVDPLGSMLLLPVTRYPNDPVLSLQFSTQAQMDVHATPTFALTASTLQVELIVNRRQVSVLKFPFVDWDLVESTYPYAASQNETRIELLTPGSYTGQLYRGYTSSSARGDITAGSGENSWRIESLGVNFRRFKMSHLQIENDLSRVPNNSTVPNFTASYYNDFLTDKSGTDASELGSVLDANVPVSSGARIYLIGDVTGGTNVQLKVLNHRIYGDLRKLKLIR